jgi:hypothetical protein
MTNVTALPPPDPPPLGTPAASAPDLRRHLDRVIVLYLLFMGSAVVAEWAFYPDRAGPLGLAFAIMVGACGGAFLLARRTRLAAHPVTIGVGLMSAMASRARRASGRNSSSSCPSTSPPTPRRAARPPDVGVYRALGASTLPMAFHSRVYSLA